MKIIISRKGFDSKYGRVPSPIFPDGRIVSLPIPATAGVLASSGKVGNISLGEVMADLTKGRLDNNTLIHIDPDIEVSTLSRKQGWQPAFGQVGSAQSHLCNQKVGVGDLFLFFGWFRPVELHDGHWRYVAKVRSFHSLFGWLRVSEVIPIEDTVPKRLPHWLLNHPHVAHANQFVGKNNTVYVGGNNIDRGHPTGHFAGAGMFKNWSPYLKLTADGKSKSVWSVPTWLAPTCERPALTYHDRTERWIRDGTKLFLATVAIGQEFVLDTSHYPESIPWVKKLIQEHI